MLVVRVEERKRPPICQACRRAIREQAVQTGKRTCSECGASKSLAEFGGFDKRGWLRAGTCFSCQYKARPKNRRREQIQNRKRKDVRYATWDGVTDREILDADWWECQMPRCLNPEGRAITEVGWPDPWSPSIDHILPLSMGGTDIASNKRSAHLRCNVSAGNHAGQRAKNLCDSWEKS